MGSTFSSNNNVAVVLIKPHWCPGELVQGAVLLNINEAIECNELSLAIIGVEKTYWEETRSETRDGQTHTTTDYYRGEQTFFHMTAQLCAWRDKEKVQPGQYQFPFCVMLPPDVPPSFSVPYGKNPYGAHIEYHVSALCRRPGIFKANLKHDEPMTVLRAPPAPTPGLQPAGKDDVEVKRGCCCCFCCSQGGVTLSATLDRDVYLPGEQAIVTLQVTNSSKVAFKRGEVFLQRRLDVRASGACRQHVECLATVLFEGLRPGASLSSLQLRLPIPADTAARPTLIMSIIQNTYQVGLRLKAGACTRDPVLLVPCGVFPRLPGTGISGYAPPSADYWKPTVIGQVVTVADNAPAAIGK